LHAGPQRSSPGATKPVPDGTGSVPGATLRVLRAAERTIPDPIHLPACAVCGNPQLYKKKDFPHTLGMSILVLACLASTITYALYDKVLTWAILLGSAAFDGLLYLGVKDVIVCYRCGAHHRGVTATAEHQPFELTIHERYRQERLRQEQVTRSQSSALGGTP
jgi:hypothetical protein